ncbi:MAG: OmpH family outer membrane protein [Desulfobulbaceae bacterium]|nr:OmpH family outer membrane protein [Desulfobulbaceae bacterium]MCK5436948.1 OmpH family outer membrane protein [Desulfobulbaceae bacterium]MCK5544690.1 OmpH family outer membrane protein [Desulfobulbaceae bacterium]
MNILRACLLFFVLGFMSLFFGMDLAQAQAQTKDQIKIGTISIQQILSESEVGLKARQILEAKAAEFREKFEAEQKKMDALRADLQKRSTVMSEKAIAAEERAFGDKIRELKRETEDAQYEMKQLEKKVMEPILKVLHEVIAEVGKNGNYAMIMENTRKGLQSRIGLLYTDDSMDISEQVRKEMDKRLAE